MEIIATKEDIYLIQDGDMFYLVSPKLECAEKHEEVEIFLRFGYYRKFEGRLDEKTIKKIKELMKTAKYVRG